MNMLNMFFLLYHGFIVKTTYISVRASKFIDINIVNKNRGKNTEDKMSIYIEREILQLLKNFFRFQVYSNNFAISLPKYQ